MAARDLGPWTYTADDGRTFVRRADKFITGQTVGDPAVAKVGGDTAAALTPYEPMPKNLKPRGLYCSGSGGKKAFVVIYDQATYAAALETPITLNVRDGGGSSVSVTSYKGLQEVFGAAIGRGQ
jgi:hypothetical protein